jgi:hypothetical protein
MHQQAHHHCHNHHTTIILTTPAILLFSSVCYHNGKFNAQVLKQIPVLSKVHGDFGALLGFGQ